MEIDVKKILVKPIQSKYANAFIKKNHYSGKIVNNSKLHFGCFYNEVLHGVLSFGSPFDKRKVLGLVTNTKWNEMFELNRMAFDNYLPKNSESRCISVCIKLIKRNYPLIKWVLSYADATQCGDGAIYRASGFDLTAVKENRSILKLVDGSIVASMTLTKSKYILTQNGRAGKPKDSEYLKGFQLRYIYLIDKTQKITVPIIPFSKIQEMGAGMYKGVKKCGSGVNGSTLSFQDKRNVQINSTAQ